MAPFLFSDEVGEANNTLNEFTHLISELVQEFVDFFIVVENGEEKLTAAATEVKAFVIDALKIAVDVIRDLKDIFLESEEGLTGFTNILQMAVVPLELLLKAMTMLEPSTMKFLIQLQFINKVLPITNALQFANQLMMMRTMMAMQGETAATAKSAVTYQLYNGTLMNTKKIKKLAIADSYLMYAASMMEAAGFITVDYAAKSVTLTMKGLVASMGIFVALLSASVMTTGLLSDALLALAGVAMLVAMTNIFKSFSNIPFGLGIPAAIGVSVAMLGGLVMLRNKLRDSMKAPVPMPAAAGGGAGFDFNQAATYDSGGTFMGGRMYDMGGPTTEHGTAILQKGETVIPKTRNMLDGGITLNIGGDIVTDNAEDFAERIAQVLPEALRKQNDIGGI
tara:strand:+ start:5 stop:1186 length:1182 start_codon:yes stop_codon:yes gene_type:complete